MAYVKDKLTLADIKKALMNKEYKDRVLTAESIMNQWRSLLNAIGADKNKSNLLFACSMADMALAAHTLDIKLVGERQYDKPEGLAHDFCLCLKGMGYEVATPWEDCAELEPSSSSGGNAQPFDPNLLMREVNEAGQVTNQASVLSSAGFEIGCHVKRKVDGIEGVIDSVESNGMVRIKVEGDIRLAKLKMSAILNGEWIKFTPSAEPVVMDSLAQHYMARHESWKSQVAIAKLTMSLDALAKKNDQVSMDKFKFQLRPQKAIMVTTKFAKHKLVLVPLTTGIKPKTHGHCHVYFVYIYIYLYKYEPYIFIYNMIFIFMNHGISYLCTRFHGT